jgi:hypothetical protein
MTHTKEKDEAPFRKSGYPAGPVSMGGGRRLKGRPSDGCKGKPNEGVEPGAHDHVAISCIQSVEHFVCQNEGCDDHYYD